MRLFFKMQRCLSVVISAYNEEETIVSLYDKLKKNLNKLQQKALCSQYEICFVDDGSTDATGERIKKIADADPTVILISLRKNFGKSAALQAGFQHTSGDIIITMDADLQDDAGEIGKFIKKIDEGYDLVSGWKTNRKDPLEKRLPSKVFNFVTSKVSGIALHDFNCGFKAYRRDVVKSLNVYGEFHRYIPLLARRNGFKIGEIPVKHHKRRYGYSKFGAERYLRGLFDAISALFLMKFYDKPMYFFGKFGLFLFSIGFLICSYLTLLWFSGQAIGHRPLLLLGVLFILVGFQSFSLGLIANLIVDNAPETDKDIFIQEIYHKGAKDEK